MSDPTQQTETTPTEQPISLRANSVARGLLRTDRAVGGIKREYGMLRVRARRGVYYWIDLDGHRVIRGKTLLGADELQPKFIDAMERAGH